mgnify:CR=1 FL=1
MAASRVSDLAGRMAGLRPSTIREILKVTAQPHVISFAGGLPAPELFPVEEVASSAAAVLRDFGAEALQYGESEGYRPLRGWIADEMRTRGVETSPEDILVTNGSQQVLDLVGKALLDPGDVVLTETPTYLAAIQAFQVHEVDFLSVPTDEQGLIPELLPELIQRHRPKLLYTIPNFQNPTGITLAADRRERIARIAAEHELLVVEDDPYGKLRYRGDELPPIRHWDTEGRVLYASTFSKTIAPGLRVGWLVAPEGMFEPLLILKQASDLHTSSLDQRIAHHYLTHFDQTAHLERIRSAYGERFGILDEALRRELPSDYSWTSPDGGMFLWVTAPEAVDTLRLLERAVERDVAFVPGRDFFPTDGGANYLRLNFSNSTPERIREGVARLGALCRDS